MTNNPKAYLGDYVMNAVSLLTLVMVAIAVASVGHAVGLVP